VPNRLTFALYGQNPLSLAVLTLVVYKINKIYLKILQVCKSELINLISIATAILWS